MNIYRYSNKNVEFLNNPHIGLNCWHLVVVPELTFSLDYPQLSSQIHDLYRTQQNKKL